MASPKGKRSRSEHMKRLNERRKKDPDYERYVQEQATKGKQNSEKFKQAGRDTLNRLRKDPDFQKAHSKAAAERARRYGIASCRRSIPVRYRDRKGREFRFRSILECKFALLADLNGQDWDYEPVSFPYWRDGRIRHYIPDFWVQELGEYVECKGYKTQGVTKQLSAVMAENPQISIRLWTAKDARLSEAPDIWVEGRDDLVFFESFKNAS